MGMNTIIEELDRSSKTIAPEKLQEVIKKIKEHKRIFVYGTGRSGLMLKAFAMRLMQRRIGHQLQFFERRMDRPGTHPLY